MGLIYDSGDSSGMTGALKANLLVAVVGVEDTESACDTLGAALDAGHLSGKGYSAVGSLFSEVITPCLADVKCELDSVQDDLDTYTQEDSKVSHFGVLKEDELREQLEATRAQRDATERLIETNDNAADSVTALPGLGDALRARNQQLEMVLSQLESDIRDLEDRLQALQEFDAGTRGLFQGSLEVLSAAGDTVSALKQVLTPGGVGVLALARGGLKYTDQKLFLDGEKLRVDARGRVRWGSRKYMFDRYGSPMSPDGKSRYLYKNGQRFNVRTGARIDTYKQPIRAGASAIRATPSGDFKGWKDASKLSRLGKGLGIFGTALTVGNNANKYFHDGAQGNDVRDFAIDTAVDVGGAAAAAGVGAAVGSFFLPPLGTAVGAVVGLGVNALMNWEVFDGKSAIGWAKEGLKKGWDALASKFW